MGRRRGADRIISRRRFLVWAGSTVALAGLGACGSRQQAAEPAPAEGIPEMPDQPVNLTILDVAGNLQLTRTAIEDYARSRSDVVRNVDFTTAPTPELTNRIQTQQDTDQVDITVALTGVDGLAAGIEQGVWLMLIPNFQEALPDLEQIYVKPEAQELAQGQGVLVSYGNYGPTFTYNPERIPIAPRNVDELLAFARENPGQFMYAYPANSGPGRILLMGLPYILGDQDPKAPETWENTWRYLEQLDRYVEYYPSETEAAVEELGRGRRAILATSMGWDMNPRISGDVPTNFEAFTLDDTTLISDGHYAAIPDGLDAGRLAVALDLISYLLQPDQQALAYDDAYFYPGPAVQGVTPEMASEESRKAIASAARPQFDQLIETLPIETQLDATALLRAFEIWDERIGGSKVRE